mmetsp:Transcript_4494/g.14315  ORF Transcript_4494/g.14315 Transcript_4494/m.14315 type:complete len:211 (+) Transcript_4494:13-645(+)
MDPRVCASSGVPGVAGASIVSYRNPIVALRKRFRVLASVGVLAAFAVVSAFRRSSRTRGRGVETVPEGVLAVQSARGVYGADRGNKTALYDATSGSERWDRHDLSIYSSRARPPRARAPAIRWKKVVRPTRWVYAPRVTALPRSNRRGTAAVSARRRRRQRLKQAKRQVRSTLRQNCTSTGFATNRKRSQASRPALPPCSRAATQQQRRP